MRFSTATASHRKNSEDRLSVIQLGDGWVIAVADGTGGISGGAQAAELFIAGVERFARDDRGIGDPAAWVDLLEAIDAEIDASPSGGETTGVALAVTSTGHLVGASCGDGRAWFMTRDTAHELTSNQRRAPRLGTGRAVVEPFSSHAYGTLVIGTDGLFDYVAIDAIRSSVAHGADAEALIALVRDRHRILPDDVAVVVAWLD